MAGTGTGAPPLVQALPRQRSERWGTLQLLLAGVILVQVWRIQDVLPFLARIQFPSLVTVACIGFFVARGGLVRLGARIRHPLLRLVLVILLMMALSVPWSVYPGLSFRFIVQDHIKTVLTCLMLAACIRGPRDVERLWSVNLLGAAVYVSYVLAKFQVDASGRLGSLLYYDANDLAFVLVCVVPLGVYRMRPGATWRARIVAMIVCALAAIAIVRSGSRGGFLGLMAVAVFLLLMGKSIPAGVRVSALAMVGLVLALVAGDRYWGTMASITTLQSDYNLTAESGRIEVWKRGLGYMARRPLNGVGANAFSVAEGTFSALARRQEVGIGLKWSAAHNSFVQIGAELGVIGLAAFLSLLWSAFHTLWSLRQVRGRGGDNARVRALAEAMTASLLGYVVAGFFLSQAYSAMLYVTLGLVVGLDVSWRGAGGTPRRASGLTR